MALYSLSLWSQTGETQPNNVNCTLFSIIILLLVSFMVILIAFLYREYHLNKRLKASEAELRQRNLELTGSEVELRKSKELAEKASLMKSLFIQNMTHEIRTPLNSIVGFSQVITSMFDAQGETQDFTQIIEENSSRLLKLIDDVLDLSDQESAEMLELTDTDINWCCDQSIDKVRAYLHKGVTIEFHPGREILLFPSNALRLIQILYNLLHNAARATLKGGITLGYTVSEDDKELVFTVTDTGIGIPEDKHEVVFERFAKLDDFTQGFGLGLPLCRLLTQKLGGTIVIDKEYTDGCRFVLTFPALKP